MIFVTLFTVLFATMVICTEKAVPPKEGEPQLTKEQEQMRQFFLKYCKETDQSILKKLEKCEDSQPKSIKDIEMECVKKILKKTTAPDYIEIQKVECDETLGPQFDECENDKMKGLPDSVKTNKSLSEIAIKIMHCGFDVYGIKY